MNFILSLKQIVDVSTMNSEKDLMEINLEPIDIDETPDVGEKFVFIDLHGFKAPRGRFICKEICCVDDNSVFHALVKSSYPFNKLNSYCKRQANWLTKYFHGLTFDCGDTSIDSVLNIVYPKIIEKTVIVKGIEKVPWVKYMFRHYGYIECINIEDLDYDREAARFSEPYDICAYHNEVFGWKEGPCALSGALKLKDIANKNSLNLVTKKEFTEKDL